MKNSTKVSMQYSIPTTGGCGRPARSGFIVRSIVLLGAILAASSDVLATSLGQRDSLLFESTLEWSLPNHTYTGNPYDLVATVEFRHEASGESRTTGMFFDGDDNWRFRFTATQPGMWNFATRSDDADLNGLTGSVMVAPELAGPGFVKASGSRWIRSGTGQAFVPQLVMYSEPHGFYQNPEKVDRDIEVFMGEHGFSGFHVPVYCRWFQIDDPVCDRTPRLDYKIAYRMGISRPPDLNPDPRTFEALELVISRVYQSGGTTHLWAWGDDQRRWTPTFLDGGINGEVDRRLQRYIAARLGPMPGWTMGYGFDLWEWVNREQLDQWYGYMKTQLGWDHLLGARAHKNTMGQLSESLDYSSYEQHRPDYQMYLYTIRSRPDKPAFSEDRFRLRSNPKTRNKNYTMTDVRRGLWRSSMAGGVANIWGNLALGEVHGADHGSEVFPHPEWVKTYSDFFVQRQTTGLTPFPNGGSTVAARTDGDSQLIYYAEDTDTVYMELGDGMTATEFVAVDALKPYAEMPIDMSGPGPHIWRAPYSSDWAVAVRVEKDQQR